MLESSLNVLTVAGSLRRGSVARVIIDQTVRQLKTVGCADDVLDFQKEPLALYNPDAAHDLAGYAVLQARVERADLSGKEPCFLAQRWG